MPHDLADPVTSARPRPGAPAAAAGGQGWSRRQFTRAAFYAHLWIGVLFTVALVVISITGILLNHKRGLGLMPDVAHEPSRPFGDALPLARLGEIALAEVARREGSAVRDDGYIDRMDVRPRNGYVKVRLRDAASTEVTVDLASGSVLHVGRRGDVFLERLHSGEAFGGGWVLLSDAAAVGLVVVLASGYWLWLAPKIAAAGRPAGARPTAPATAPATAEEHL